MRISISFGLFENHVSFKGYQADLDLCYLAYTFENHVSFKGYQAISDVLARAGRLRTM